MALGGVEIFVGAGSGSVRLFLAVGAGSVLSTTTGYIEKPWQSHVPIHVTSAETRWGSGCVGVSNLPTGWQLVV